MTARLLAFEVLRRVGEGGYADRCLDAALQRQELKDPRDRALATELVYGVLRVQNRLDFALDRLTKQSLSKLEPSALLLLRLGAYQILDLDRIPGPIAVHETVNLAKRVGLQRVSGLINAVLRRLVREAEQIPWPDPQRDPVKHLRWALSLPDWLARRWHRELGPEATELAANLLKPAPFTLRVNTLKSSRAEYLTLLTQAGHRGVATRYAPEGVRLTERGPEPLPGDRDGLYQVQDEASMLVTYLVDPQPKEKLLDVCAAPGGKTTHMAALAQNRATIEALDLHPHRVKLIEQGAQRLGCTGIAARAWDMLKAPEFLEAESFDAVLVDAPCSGLGVLRRNPEARWRLQAKDIAELAGRQKAILDQAAGLVRPGGRMIYSVCTVTPEETTAVVEDFLQKHPEFTLRPLREVMPETCSELIGEDGAMHTWPHRQGLDGFYAVRFERNKALR